jgi:hypothetical protein
MDMMILRCNEILQDPSSSHHQFCHLDPELNFFRQGRATVFLSNCNMCHSDCCGGSIAVDTTSVAGPTKKKTKIFLVQALWDLPV